MTLIKGAVLHDGNVPFLPDPKSVKEYIAAEGICIVPLLWSVGYNIKTYVPFPDSYNIQMIVDIKEVKEVVLKTGESKLLLEVFSVTGVKDSSIIKMTFWRDNANRMNNVLR